MLRRNYHFGIPYKFHNIDELFFSSLSRQLFLSQSIGVKEAVRFVNKIPVLDKEEIEKVFTCLKKEVVALRDAGRCIYGFKKRAQARLKDWIEFFGCTSEEIKIYVDYYGLSDKGIKAVGSGTGKSALNPRKIQAMLDEYIIGSHTAKRKISIGVYSHLIRAGITRPIIRKVYAEKPFSSVPNLPNPNIVLIGSTGTGKSYMVKTIAQLFDLPLLKIDCASLTASGYMGNGLNDHLYIFFSRQAQNQSFINRSIIFFDEFDKLSEYNTKRPEGSVGGVEMQQEFLNLLEDKDYLVQPSKRSQGEPFTIDLNNSMFIFGGSFSGIEKIIEKRAGLKALGFKKYGDRNKDENDILSYATPSDLVTFGIIPELAGRVNHIIKMEEHSKESIIQIIKKSKGSALKTYENYFDIHFDSLTINDDVYELIAEKVLETKTGARAIHSILNELLKDFMYETPNVYFEQIVIDRNYFQQVFGL